MVETKALHFIGTTQGIASGQKYGNTALNLWSQMGAGTSQAQVIGNEFDVRYIEFRYSFEHTGTSPLDLQTPVMARITVVKAADIWLLDTPTAPFITTGIPGNLFNPVGSLMPAIHSKFNSNVVKVLWQKKIVLRPAQYNVSGQLTSWKVGKFKPRGLKGKKTFASVWGAVSDTADGTLKNAQYYVVIELQSFTNSSATHDVKFRYDFSVYYKDL